MGSGKKNYRALRASTRQWRSQKKVAEEKKVPPKNGDVENLLDMWKRMKKEQ